MGGAEGDLSDEDEDVSRGSGQKLQKSGVIDGNIHAHFNLLSICESSSPLWEDH